jgi:4-hydroxy-3-polyprenylbenzoate decarboxylase
LICERRGPAPLFENVKDYPGHRLAAVLLGPSAPALHARTALALGLDKTTSTLDLIEAIRHRLKQPQKPVRVRRNDAPCKEVICRGEEASLLRFPFPWIKEIDGGRYVGTWALIVAKDPQTGWVNWATYRCMMVDERRFAVLFMPRRQHGGAIFKKYEDAGRPMPIALVIGAEPACHLAATTPIEYGVSEAEAAGALRGEGIPVVQCETSDLEVPATAEIVIEAELSPGERVDEGPFGEYTGHAAHRGKLPVARVTCITHRVNPITTMANMGKPYDDYATPTYVLKPAVAKNRLEALGLPVRSVYHYVPDIAVVSIKPGPGVQRQIVSAFLSGSRLMGTGVVFVDEDVDVTSVQDVWWAICSRMNPESYEVIKGVAPNTLMPWLSPEQRETREATGWVMDATFPHAWPAEYRESHTRVADFDHGWSEAVKEKVHARWREYGYDGT